MTQSPNILLFVMDACQASALEDSSPCLTPNFDRLAGRGMQFHRAYCPSPTCSPSRASLMTGLLPHNHGVLEVEHGRDADQCVLRTEFRHWVEDLFQAGYTTGYFGKWHVERSHELERFGWQYHHVKGAGHHAGLGKGEEPSARNVVLDPALSRYHRGPEGYGDILHYGVTDLPPGERYPAFTVNRGIEFLENRVVPGRPWCAMLSFSEPNEALVVGREAFERYDVEKLPLPESLRDPFDQGPNLYRRQARISADLSDDEWRMARACYFGRITELDAEFGRLHDFLDESGLLENTLIIVTADHGRYLGAHGFDAHNVGPFEEIYRVPLVVAGPGVSPGVSRSFVGFHDIGPTLIEHCLGKERQSLPADSVSFASVLRDPERQVRETMYAENHGTRFSLTQRILWKGDWKFVFNGFDFDELYDLESDPWELNNLAADPVHRDRVRAMMGEVWRWIRETGDRTLLETHYFSMRMGAVGPDWVPQDGR